MIGAFIDDKVVERTLLAVQLSVNTLKRNTITLGPHFGWSWEKE
jgi:hypothetical protein